MCLHETKTTCSNDSFVGTEFVVLLYVDVNVAEMINKWVKPIAGGTSKVARHIVFEGGLASMI